MKNRALISSIAYQWRSWMQILSVAFVEQKAQMVSSLIITVISLLLTTWFIVPISFPLLGVNVQLFLLIPSIWILVMSHLSFTERINRPLKFAVSLPAPRWKWWLSRVIVSILINAMVTGLVILVAIAWIRLADAPPPK